MIQEEETRPEEKAYLRKLYRVRQTVASIVRQRGYVDPGNILQESESFEEFSLKYRQNAPLFQNLLFFKSSDMNVKLVVLFECEKQKQLTDIRVTEIMQRIQSQQINNVLIIVNGDPNQPNVIEKKARAKIDEINSMQSYSCQVFNMDDLVFDITKHELVPQHILITPEEKKGLLERYRLTESQLPRILLSDPISKFLGLKNGDVVKIVRKSETAGVYVTYRIAV